MPNPSSGFAESDDDPFMSWVANILLSVDILEDPALVREFDRWLQTEAPRRDQPEAKGVGSIRALHDSADAWGGSWLPEARLWAGVLSQADIPAIVERFGAMGWRFDDMAQLFVQDQEQGAFRLWMIHDGRVHQHAPLPDFEADEYEE